MLKFSAFLRDEKEQAPRSVYNKFENVMTFLKANGIRGLVGKNDWPRYTEEEPEIYEREELDKLFAKCGAEERLWYEFFLMTGMREQEPLSGLWLTRTVDALRLMSDQYVYIIPPGIFFSSFSPNSVPDHKIASGISSTLSSEV